MTAITTGPLTGGRFLTFNSVVRVNQIEVGRGRNEGFDERDRHTPENVEALRFAFEAGWPGAPMTWGLSWQALQDDAPNYRAIREMLVGYHRRFGDEVTFCVGGFFANAYNTRSQVNRDLHDGLAMASAIVGGSYRPRSVLAGFLAAENLRYLAEVEGVHVCQGNIWSQYAVDNQDGDGSVCYPYYPSREHFLKPAQGPKDFIDCVNLDGWTCDFVSAHRPGWTGQGKSRQGVGPIETIGTWGPEIGLKAMLHTTTAHFDSGFELNGWAWVTNCWEISLVKQFGNLECLTRWTAEIRRRWPAARCVTQGEFGLLWRQQFPDNSDMDYRFRQRGCGIGGSSEELEIRWFMNRGFRLALLRNWRANEPENVIDFTRYDLPASEPQELCRNWSLINRINQKQTRPEDKPVQIGDLRPDEREMIARRYPELAG
jgi:hypothetical protein